MSLSDPRTSRGAVGRHMSRDIRGNNMLVSDNSGAARARSPSARFISAASALLLALFAYQASAAPPFGLPDRGVLRLQLGGSQSRQFLYQPASGTPTGQSILLSGKCGLVLASSPSLATLTAAGGLNSMGLGPDSIGVFDGPKGVACYRITASLNESVTFGLGTTTTGSSIDANAFYRLELDIEVKQNAVFLLEILIGGTVADQFYLRTGTSIVAGEGSTSPGSADHIFNCGALSDSGPDAGSSDNCRWVVEALGQQFRLTPLVGEGSLEGGGDFGSAAYANNSLMYLTKATIGALGCANSPVPQGTTTPTIGDGVNDAQCSVTRIDPTGLGGSCTTAVGYVLRNIGGAEGCEMLKTPGEQLAASAEIQFPPEPRTALGAEPLTTIVFSTPSGVPYPTVFTPQRCTGTVVPDSNGERTIREVLDGGTVGYDHVPGGFKDWACVLDNVTEYLGNDQMQIRQTILFWGDIEIKRQ
jgi:hypothetical protein